MTGPETALSKSYEQLKTDVTELLKTGGAMFNQKKYSVKCLVIIALLSTMSLGTSSADEKRNMRGWGKNSPYNKLYNVAEMDEFKGSVVDIIEIVPFPDMSPGVALLVRDSDGETIEVHLCPSWFMNRRSIGIRQGDKIKVRGAFAEINDKEIFMGSKVKKGKNFSVKVRLTSDGTPFWTMSPDQLAKERGSN